MDAGFASVVCAMIRFTSGNVEACSTSIWTSSLAYPRRCHCGMDGVANFHRAFRIGRPEVASCTYQGSGGF